MRRALLLLPPLLLLPGVTARFSLLRAGEPAPKPVAPVARMKVPGEIKALEVSGDGKAIAILHRHGFSIRAPDGAIRIDRLDSGSIPDATAIALSRDGRRVALGGARGGVRLWESYSMKLLRLHDEPRREVRSLALSSDDALLAAAGTDGRVCLFPVASNKPAWPCVKLEDEAQTVALSPDGALLAASGNNGAIHFYGTGDGAAAGVIPGSDTVNRIAFSPDGRLLAAGGNDSFVRVWRVADRTAAARFPRGGDWVASLQFAADSDRLAWVTSNGELHVAALSSGASLLDARTGCESVNGLAVAGEFALAGCEEDGLLRYALPAAPRVPERTGAE